MIHDIEPLKLNNEYLPKKIMEKDCLLIVNESEILIGQKDDEIYFPKLEDMNKKYFDIDNNSIYLFEIDGVNFFLLININVEEEEKWKYETILMLRDANPMWKVFAATLGGQLNRWYKNHKFCGKCGSEFDLSNTERALICPTCGVVIYPTISPSVIVAITKGDEILLTKYAFGAYKRYALVAGYTEVGESLEQTVEREVMEEVGLKVKNITYYKTQPWPFSDTLLIGYFAEVDGDDTVTLQESELSEATWFKQDEIPENPSKISLTSEMIDLFRNNMKVENIAK
ncbi:MAG: NAD(+) diphosphatase [Lachnotalea sp.]